jgi:NAD+ synthase (glutamine-hydrolysing)
MKVYNPNFSEGLEPDLMQCLRRLQNKRGFDVDKYVQKKTYILNEYMRRCKLSACVVAVSGGIDSAVTLGLVCRAAKLQDSPIKKIIAVSLPIFNAEAATNQKEALEKSKELAKTYGIDPVAIDLTEVFMLMKNKVDLSSKMKGSPWASGQLVAYIRTPALYYLTSLLTQEGYSAVLCGTTNRDEGAYLGYVGKASDGMVDLQLISDLHKSEVYKLAEFLKIPENIKKAVPTGDMYDGRADEEVFGAPYDFVELYLLYKSIKDEKDRLKLRKNWSKKAADQFEQLAGNLEKLHNYNAHKYFVGSPAVHLDIYESGVPGGWPERKSILEII